MEKSKWEKTRWKRIDTSRHYKRLWNVYGVELVFESRGKKIYTVKNKPNSQVYEARLVVFSNGCAIMFVDYTSYSGVKEKHNFYYDKNGNEIAYETDADEKRCFEEISGKSISSALNTE
jgi:hypothetical protein